MIGHTVVRGCYLSLFQLWIAKNGTGCPMDKRCTVPFSSKTDFIEGSYIKYSGSLCEDPNIIFVDEECGSGCSNLRRGVCALAPAITPRTHLPSRESPCQPQDPNDNADWPYEGYLWTQQGVPGQNSVQVFKYVIHILQRVIFIFISNVLRARLETPRGCVE
jgi:hypothetical protein